MQSNIDLNSLDVNQVLQLIQATLSGDNERIKLATRLLKTYTKHKASIGTLTYILINSSQLGHRQMVTVLLKRNLINLYESLSVQQKTEFRSLLIQQYAKQPHLLVQRGIATLISILLPVVEIKNWLQLQQLLDQAIQSSPNSAATFVLLNSILYHFKPPAGLYNYLLNALLNQKLAEQAIKCVVAVVETQDIDPSFAIQFIQIWQKANWPEEISIIAIQVLTTMIERKLKLADDVTVWLCDKIVGNRKAPNRLRAAGCDYLFSFAQFSPKQLSSKQHLLKKVVETVCLTCAQPYRHREQQEQQTGEFVQQIALWLIQTLAITIKPKKIYPVLFDAAVSLIKSEDTNQINTGFLVLGAICQGCGQRVKNNLQNPIMNVLIPRGLSHPAPEVKGAAINALCYFSQHLIPDIFEYHAVIIPALLNHVGDHSTKVAGKALIAIDVFFDGMDQEDIIQYLSISVPRLIQVLGSSHSTPLMKAAAISAIGSAVYVSQQKFQPYLESVLNVCLFLLKLEASPELNTVRAQNLNVLGKLANVFCKQEYINHQLFYQTYIMGTMEQVYILLQNQKQSEIKQAAFAYFYLIANAIGNRFELVFDNLIPIVIASCQPKEEKKKQFSLDSDSEDQEQPNIITHKITEQDQKAAAIHALGEFAKACPLKFVPYFQEAYRILEEHYQHFYQNIRIQVCHCYTNLTLGLVKSQYNGVIPKPLQGLPCINRYPQAIEQHFRTVVVPRILTLMTEDDDNRVRGAAVQSIDDLIKQLGPAFIDRNINPLKEAIMKLLQAEIDQDDEQEQAQGEQDEDETEVQTFQSLCDLIPTLAQNLRAGFEPTLHQLHPYMVKYIEERQDINDNVQMTGCLSQCFKWVPGYAANFADELFVSLGALVPLWETEVNRNVAYCFAEMFQKSAYFFTKYLQQGLILLKQIFEHESSSQACKDNAVAAICRIIYTINPPMPHQVFVDNLIKMLPFQGDQQEQSAALKAILFLVVNNPQVLSPHRDSIVRILENDLSQVKKYKLQEPLITQLQNLLQKIKG